jgi:hypothetical protein
MESLVKQLLAIEQSKIIQALEELTSRELNQEDLKLLQTQEIQDRLLFLLLDETPQMQFYCLLLIESHPFDEALRTIDALLEKNLSPDLKGQALQTFASVVHYQRKKGEQTISKDEIVKLFLKEYKRHQNQKIKAAIIKASSYFTDPKLLELYKHLIKTNISFLIQEAVIEALTNYAENELIAKLLLSFIEIKKSSNPLLIKKALQTLSFFSLPIVMEEFLNILHIESKHPSYLRQAACRAVASSKNEAYIQPLIQCAIHESCSDVRLEAINALGISYQWSSSKKKIKEVIKTILIQKNEKRVIKKQAKEVLKRILL